MTPQSLRFRLSPLVLVALAAGCAAEAPVGSTDAPVIYDEDDRYDVYEISPSSLHRQIAESAIGAIIVDGLVDNDDGTYSPYDWTLADALANTEAFFGYPMCPGERYGDQPAAGSCSGTLIADDLFMTAGHCASLCDNPDAAIVFDFYYAEEGVLETIDASDVYFCDHVVVEALTGGGLDYAIFALDRPALDRTPVLVDRDYSVTEGDPLVVMGFPTGMPLKLEDGGEVVDARASANPDYFIATTDTFAGNSGSGVFDADGVAVGILVRGQQDYALYDATVPADGVADCVGVNVIDTSEPFPDAESITYVSRAIDALCAEEPARCPGTGGGGCSSAPGATSPFAALALAAAVVVLRRRRAR